MTDATQTNNAKISAQNAANALQTQKNLQILIALANASTVEEQQSAIKAALEVLHITGKSLSKTILQQENTDANTVGHNELHTSIDSRSDNPSDENYRYADTGYIAGSHKERASNRIKELAKDGVTVKATDIEWDEIESNPLIAEDVIKKSNIMGSVDYQALKNQDMEAGTAYLIQKVLASVGPEPYWDVMSFLKNSVSGRRIINGRTENELRLTKHFNAIPIADQKALARRAYVNGINAIKSRLVQNKSILSTKDLIAELKAIASEMYGHNISASDESRYNQAVAKVTEQKELIENKSLRFESEYKAAESLAVEGLDVSKNSASKQGFVEYRKGSFIAVRRQSNYYARQTSMKNWLADKYPDIKFNKRFAREIAPIVIDDDIDEYKARVDDVERIVLANKLETLLDPLSNLAWISLGERFWNIVELQSDAFIKHANMAIRGKYNDWGLTIKPEVGESDESNKQKGKKKKTFELIVADNIERTGGKPVTINSTKELKEAFGFRDIQSGNWVLKDKTSAKFHVENSAAAMMDLSDIVGIDPKSLAFGGRLALSLGARGTKGALAHYEPVQRVINITKMKGGGSLGHEWFHAIDNILGEVLAVDGATGIGKYLSVNPKMVVEKSASLSEAFAKLQETMTIGDSRAPEAFKVTHKDVELALLNIQENSTGLAKLIFDAKGATEAVDIIDSKFYSPYRSKRRKNHNQWRKVAVAFFNQDKVGETVVLNTGEPVSEFYANAKKLDAGRSKPYWSTTHEMAARAFQAYLEDSLEEQGRRNDYLSYGADNALYGGSHKAYPDGNERKKINMAFKNLFEIIKSEKVFENATADQILMDSIFGTSSVFSDDEDLELDTLLSNLIQ
ncbi:LPD1 domain-containing protein [Psychrobacter aestuarii]|uniref:Large polyvalent protein-associated domain-containing protein n=1 Tax=Psychrobacter aestuarii TaxID=556327 RepID=A0ABP3FJ12_9GAMM|nr:LPD1 domain-containing protein [Psychrobacter aestuarii]